VARARDFIVAHHDEGFGLDALSAACGASKSAISHSMTEQMGISPIHLRTLVRLSRAQHLLAQGVKPGDVAIRVGFSDQAKLTRQLKALLGVTPARYAKMLRR
jgi:AraC-like DNA-binding protein